MIKRLLPCILFVFLLTNNSYSQVPGSECANTYSKAMQLFGEKKFREGIPFAQKSLKICSNDSTLSDYDYYSLLAMSSWAYYEIGNEDSTLINGEAAAKYFEKIKAYDDVNYNVMLSRMALAYEYYGEYDNAIRSFEQCIPFFEKQLGKTHLVTFEYYLELATCYSAISDFKRSMALNRKLYEMIVNTLGKNNVQYISVLTNMGNDFLALGIYDSAMIFHSESLELRKQVLGANHPEYAKGLSIIGQVYNDQNRFNDAISYYEMAKGIYERAQMNTSLEYASLLNGLALCYRNIGRYDNAFEYLSQSLKIKRRLFGNYHIEVAAGVNNVGNVLDEQLDYKQAMDAYRFSKYILEVIKKTETTLYTTVITNLGNCMTNMGQYDSALYFLNAGLAAKEKLFGQYHITIANSVNNIASLYSDLGKFEEAKTYYQRARNIIEHIYGKDALQISTVNQNQGLLYKKMNDSKRADSLFKASYGIVKKFIINNTEGLSEKDKEGFAEDIRLTQYTALSLREPATLPNDWILNSSLFYKGLLLEGVKGVNASFKSLGDSSMQRKAAEYFSLKTKIGQELLKPEASRSKDLPDNISKSAALERELLKQSSSFRNWKDQFNIDWKDVQNKLNGDDISIEFLAYYPLGIKTLDSTLYAAMMIKPGMQDPLIIPLFYETDINKLISKGGSTESVVKKLYRSSIKGASSQPIASDSLYRIIWKPLLPYLQNVKSIYFAADGIMNNLNLAAIITPEGKRLIEDYEFIQLSSTRNIMKPTAQLSFKDIQLWGGVKYDDNTAASSNRSTAFTYLPGTLTEVNDIAAETKKPGSDIQLITGEAANETAFKKISGNSPEVLHIATHGFFFPDPSKAAKKDDNRFANADNPLLRSGIALAHANENWKEGLVSSDKEDGIATAYEIADMDLSKTKLVVLSACETGLGDIKSGEGVYGLQRAFKLAGVEYLIMSLWQVPDMETKEFMQTFYKNCISGMPIRKAFRETQLAMNKKYQPYQWAAFVLVE